MPTNPPDYVSGAEFKRWMTEQSDFRQRLEVRLGNQHTEVVGTLRRIEDQVRETNGRTQRNTEAIVVLTRDVEALKSEEQHVEAIVESIKDEGCSQYQAHVEAIQQLTPVAVADWSARKKVGVIAALTGGGALMWPAIQKIAEAVHELATKIPHP